MSRNSSLAHAARRTRALAERVPPQHRPDVSEAWGELLDSLEDLTDAAAIETIEDWQAEMEFRLTGRLVNAPLEDEAA